MQKITLPQDFKALSHWQSQVGNIPGLTQQLEEEYLQGRSPWGGSMQGSSTMILTLPQYLDEKEIEIYQQWYEKEGMPKLSPEQTQKNKKSLEDYLKKHNISLESNIGCLCNPQIVARLKEDGILAVHSLSPLTNPSIGYAYYLTQEILKLLPPSHLHSEKFKKLYFNHDGDGAAKGGNYENNILELYNVAVSGSKRLFLGLLLHELGHVFSHSLSEEEIAELRENHSKITENKTLSFLRKNVFSLQIPQNNLKEDNLEESVGIVKNELKRILTNKPFMEGTRFWGRGRNIYQYSFEEFIAETYLHYISQNNQLLTHINSLEPKTKKPFSQVYNFFYKKFEERIYIP